MEKLTIGICILVIFVVAYSAFIAFPVMLLWNWLMPVIFNLPEIGFFQSAGLVLLSAFILKSGGSSSTEK